MVHDIYCQLPHVSREDFIQCKNVSVIHIIEVHILACRAHGVVVAVYVTIFSLFVYELLVLCCC